VDGNDGIRASDFYRVLREQDARWEQRLDGKLGEVENRLAERLGGLEAKMDRFMEQQGPNRRGEWSVALSVTGIGLSLVVGALSVALAIVKLGQS
jgi:hypothetical protein